MNIYNEKAGTSCFHECTDFKYLAVRTGIEPVFPP